MKRILSAAIVALFLLTIISCGEEESDSDGGPDSDGDTEANPDGDTSTDGDTGMDGDGNASRLECDEFKGQAYCLDPTADLRWQNHAGTDLYSWEEARQYCNNLEWAGLSDWRLPTISELRSIIEGCPQTEAGGACEVEDDCTTINCRSNECAGCTSGHCYWNSAFLAPCNHSHWSNTSVADSQDTAWFAGFYNAGINSDVKSSKNLALCVRGSNSGGDMDEELLPENEIDVELEMEYECADYSESVEQEIDTGAFICVTSGTDEVCTDTVSGYDWQNPAPNSNLIWSEAITYCENLEFGTHNDWRLPTVSELRSLITGCAATAMNGGCNVDDGCTYYSCMNSDCNGCGESADCYWNVELNGDCSSNYWSATESHEETSEAWFVGFYFAAINTDAKDTPSRVRCVRNH